MKRTHHHISYHILESVLDAPTVSLIEELAHLLDGSPAYVIEQAVNDLYVKTLAKGPKEGTN